MQHLTHYPEALLSGIELVLVGPVTQIALSQLILNIQIVIRRHKVILCHDT